MGAINIMITIISINLYSTTQVASYADKSVHNNINEDVSGIN